MEKLYSIEEVAELLSVSQSTVRSWVYGGRLPSIKIVSNRRIKESDLKEFIENEGKVEE